MVDGEEGGELTLEEFLALLRYINQRVEELNKELARYQRNTRRMGFMAPGSGGLEDIMRLALASSLQSGQYPVQPGDIVEDDYVREKAKKLAKRLTGGGEAEQTG